MNKRIVIIFFFALLVTAGTMIYSRVDTSLPTGCLENGGSDLGTLGVEEVHDNAFRSVHGWPLWYLAGTGPKDGSPNNCLTVGDQVAVPNFNPTTNPVLHNQYRLGYLALDFIVWAAVCSVPAALLLKGHRRV
jgi:hypothetical protein